MKFSYRTPILLATACLTSAANAALAQEVPFSEPSPEGAAPAAAAAAPTTPTSTGDAERLRALEQRLAEQQKKIEALEADRAESALPEPIAEADHAKLRIYGFADVGGQWLGVADGPYHDLIASKPSFVLGNVNLYVDAHPSPAWRALVETRLGLFPNGAWIGLNQVDNRVMDTSSPSGRIYAIWSGIILERAWLQWTYDERLAVQAGYLLTPYGIWNVDHGTPTLISLLLPSLQVDEAIPQHQVGVQLLGAFPIDNWELAYHAYLTNGRNAITADSHWREGAGGRLVLRRIGALRVALGSSGYAGTYHKDSLLLHISTDPTSGVQTANFQKSDLAVDGGYAATEWSVGGDVSLDWQGWRFRGETMVRHVMYDDGKHEHKSFGNPAAMVPNHYSHYAYAILAYRFAGYYEPYLFIDYNDSDPAISSNKMGICYSAGLNLYFSASAMLKMQYADQRFSYSEGTSPNMNMKYAAARLVLVF
jgi:hypothetical protein